MQNITEYNDKHYNFDFYNIKYEMNEISVLLELKRYLIMQNIKRDCEYILKPINVDINNILPRWIFLQYSNNKYLIDPLFPYNGLNFTQLKKDIFYLSNKKVNDNEIDEIIKKLDLTNKFNNAIILIKNYINSEYYKQNTNFLKIKVEEENDFYIYSIKILENFENIDNINFQYLKFRIHKNLIIKCLKKYNKSIDDDQFKIIIMCIILRYNTLESYNQQLAVNPAFYKYLGEQYNINFELFASSLNCHYDNYCSLFYDLEKELNSKGSFNIINLKQGFYVANPPFDEEVMKNMALKFVECLQSPNNEDLSVLITIPAWDNPNYGDYEVLTILKKSGFIKFIKKIPKNRALFFDYFKNKYIYPCDIYFILIQNEKGFTKYNITRELELAIDKYFPFTSNLKKNIYQKGGDLNYLNINMVLIKHIGYSKFDENIIFDEIPPDYKSKNIKKYYDNIAKYNSKYLLNYKDFSKKSNINGNLIEIYMKSIMENIFYDLKSVDNIIMIDMTYSCGNNRFIIKRLGDNYNEIANHFLKHNVFTNFNVSYLLNPKYNKKTDDDRIDYFDFLNNLYKKHDFIFISGNLSYHMMKSISYYSEQMSYSLHFLQLFMLLSLQELNGSFIFFIYTCDSEVYRKMIELLQNYYKEIYLYKIISIHANIAYIVGKDFLGITVEDLTKIKSIVNNIKDKNLGNDLNVFDSAIRKKHHIIKHIIPKSKNKFIHNLFDFKNNKISKQINKQINKFNKIF